MKNKSSNAYKNTKVDYVKSQMKINQYLNNNDIYDIQHSIYDGKATLTFVKKLRTDNKEVRVGIRMTLPNINEKTRNQRYRILFHYLKSKFESIAFGLFEEENNAFVKEFLPYVIADNAGKTISEIIMPQLKENNETGYLSIKQPDTKNIIEDKSEKSSPKAIDIEYEVKE